MKRTKSQSYYQDEDGQLYIDEARDIEFSRMRAELKRIHNIADQRNRAYDAARKFKRERDATQVERDHLHAMLIDLYLAIEYHHRIDDLRESNAYHKAQQVYERHQSTEAWDDMNEAEKRTWDDSVQGERI